MIVLSLTPEPNMPETTTHRRMTGAERQRAYMARVRAESYRAVDDDVLLAECQRRGLIPTDQPDTGTHTSQEDAR